MRRAAAALLALLALAGCGGAKHAAPAPQVTLEGPYGTGGGQVWLVRPLGPPKSIVVFLHGHGDYIEDTPAYHLPWLLHLARQGSAVIYPRYEAAPGIDVDHDLQNALRGVARGLDALGRPTLPAVVIGYSRGGPLAVDLSAVAPLAGLEPRGILTVFPALRYPTEPKLDLRSLNPATRIWILVGDKDTVVGDVGANELLRRLAAAGFPQGGVRLLKLVSHDGFSATHLSVYDNTAAGHSAFWDTADSLVTRVR